MKKIEKNTGIKAKFIKSKYFTINLDKIYKKINDKDETFFNIQIDQNLSFSLNYDQINADFMTFRIKLFKSNGDERIYKIYNYDKKEDSEVTANQIIELLIKNGFEENKRDWSTLSEEEKKGILFK